MTIEEGIIRKVIEDSPNKYDGDLIEDLLSSCNAGQLSEAKFNENGDFVFNEEKFEHPIVIKINQNECTLLADDSYDNDFAVTEHWVMFKGQHYGFILIADNNGYQKEYYYSTENSIAYVGMRNNHLLIFEQNKPDCWDFDRSGKIVDKPTRMEDFEKAPFASMKTDEQEMIMNHFDNIGPEAETNDPVTFLIKENIEDCVLLANRVGQENTSLENGVMLGGQHYGFTLIIDRKNCNKEIHFSTQFRVQGMQFEKRDIRDISGEHIEETYIKIYEEGKQFSWMFTKYGKLVESAHFNRYSRRDVDFLMDNCDFYNGNDRFALKKVPNVNND